MWLIPAMWKALAAVVLVVIAGLVWAGTSLVWPQHDYAAEGVCTAAEIDKTYAALAELHEFQGATNGRVRYEESRIQPRMQNLQSAFLQAINGAIDLRLARHHTAAFVCTHSCVRFEGGQPLLSIPALVTTLRPYARDADEAWTLAVFASLTGVTRYSGYKPLNAETVEHLRRGSAIRAAANRQHGRE